MFEQYWIDHFPTLLNVAGNQTGKEASPVAQQVKAALLAQIEQARQVRAVKFEQLRADVRRGLDSGKSAAWDAAQVKQQAKAKRVGKSVKA